MNDHPPDFRSADPSFSQAWTRIGEEIRSFRSDLQELPVLPSLAASDIQAELARLQSAEPLDLTDTVEAVIDLLRRGIVQVTSPRYFGLFNPDVLESGILADALVALYNPQLAAWSHAPAVNEIERVVLGRFSAALGLEPESTHANFTSGGAEANLSAVLSAIAHHFPNSTETGIGGTAARPAIYLSGESHDSFVKIARMTGLGTRALRKVPITERATLDVNALDKMIGADRHAGLYPLLIIATAGTTSAGVIDPIPDIADVAAEYGSWLHVDAAWGGAAALSPKLRPELSGIERADSITWDAHKWLSVPMAAGMFFCRHPAAVRRAFGVSTVYMPGPSDARPDPYSTTAQWSRRAIGLKVFMSLTHLGEDGYARIIEQQAATGRRLRTRLVDAGWITVNDTPFPLVCFTHADIREGRVSTTDLLERIYDGGRVWISEVVFAGQERVLRACITSYRTNDADLDCLIEELEAARLTSAATR